MCKTLSSVSSTERGEGELEGGGERGKEGGRVGKRARAVEWREGEGEID